jgi:hypothetical protein
VVLLVKGYHERALDKFIVYRDIKKVDKWTRWGFRLSGAKRVKWERKKGEDGMEGIGKEISIAQHV